MESEEINLHPNDIVEGVPLPPNIAHNFDKISGLIETGAFDGHLRDRYGGIVKLVGFAKRMEDGDDILNYLLSLDDRSLDMLEREFDLDHMMDRMMDKEMEDMKVEEEKNEKIVSGYDENNLFSNRYGFRGNVYEKRAEVLEERGQGGAERHIGRDDDSDRKRGSGNTAEVEETGLRLGPKGETRIQEAMLNEQRGAGSRSLESDSGKRDELSNTDTLRLLRSLDEETLLVLMRELVKLDLKESEQSLGQERETMAIAPKKGSQKTAARNTDITEKSEDIALEIQKKQDDLLELQKKDDPLDLQNVKGDSLDLQEKEDIDNQRLYEIVKALTEYLKDS